VGSKRSSRTDIELGTEGQSTGRERAHGTANDSSGGLEAIFNLWYLTDDTGAVYSLRIHAYVGVGTKEEKLTFLRSRAELDYLVATAFPIPEQFHVNVLESGPLRDASEQRLRVAHMSALEVLGGPIVLFEDALTEIERTLPAKFGLRVGARPLVCLTPLFFDGQRSLKPLTQRGKRLGTEEPRS